MPAFVWVTDERCCDSESQSSQRAEPESQMNEAETPSGTSTELRGNEFFRDKREGI